MKRPEATNSGGWIDAEDPPGQTCGDVAAILGVMLELKRSQLDEGQRVMLISAITALEQIGEELMA